MIKKIKLPKNVELSKDLKERAIGYFEVMLYGIKYYIPFTKEMKKVLHIKKEKDKWKVPNETKLSRMLQTIISAIYLQLRDTIGAEIHQELDRELRNTFSGLFEKYINNKIDKKFKKLLPYKK